MSRLYSSTLPVTLVRRQYNYLFLVDARYTFSTLGFGLIVHHLLLVALLGTRMCQGMIGCAYIVLALLCSASYIWFTNIQFCAAN